MAASIQLQPNVGDRRLGLSILGWAVCARRALSVEELRNALDNSGLLGIHRTIGDLCGGFVVVDVEGHVAMIHETAREYLIRENHRQSDRPFTIDKKSMNDKLLLRCIQRLTDPKLKACVAEVSPGVARLCCHFVVPASCPWFLQRPQHCWRRAEVSPGASVPLVDSVCPKESITYQQFGRKEARALSISGPINNTWDDCLARFSLESGARASVIIPVGSRIAIVANVKRSS